MAGQAGLLLGGWVDACACPFLGGNDSEAPRIGGALAHGWRRNTSHRDGAQGEGPSSSSPSASRSSAAGPTSPPSSAREAPDPPPPARGFVVGFIMAVCCCCLADETIMNRLHFPVAAARAPYIRRQANSPTPEAASRTRTRHAVAAGIGLRTCLYVKDKRFHYKVSDWLAVVSVVSSGEKSKH
uniref:Cysteine-rich transmembrane CYSTM domain-containing protein n=1 Tax=Zea mays TaxID=4577 RepID=A0A804QGJ7_MAIZE